MPVSRSIVAALPVLALGGAALAFAACAPKPPAEAPVSAGPETPAAASTAYKKPLDIDDPARQPDSVYWVTPNVIVDRMLEAAEVKSTDMLYDLGSGDGRLVIAAAKKYGARGVGYEIDGKLVDESNQRAKELGVAHLVHFERKDIFTVDLSPATVITVYLLPVVLEQLIPQFNKMKPGSRIVSHNYPMPGVEPDEIRSAHLEDSQHFLLLWHPPLKVTKR